MAAPSDDLVAQAFDADKHLDLAEAVARLDPEEAQFFLLRLEAALRKRKIQLFGYLVAMLVWLVGMMAGLLYYGYAETGRFVGWVFMLPFGLVGLVLYTFGAWATRVGARGGLPTTPTTPAAPPPST